MSNFTPGKWSIGINEKHGQYVYADDSNAIIAVIRSCGYTDQSEEKKAVRQANAQLIAAAPEMYQLLRNLSFRTSGMEEHEVLKIRELLIRIDGEEGTDETARR